MTALVWTEGEGGTAVWSASDIYQTEKKVFTMSRTLDGPLTLDIDVWVKPKI